MIDDDAAAFVALDADFVEPKPFGVGHAADGDEHDVRFDDIRPPPPRPARR